MIKRIALEWLLTHIPTLTPYLGGVHMESCMVCLDEAGHGSNVQLMIDFPIPPETAVLTWASTVTDQMRRAYADENKRIDYGACAIALLIVPQFTDLLAIEQSATGTRIDYYLTPQNADPDDDLIFNGGAFLEVSGIQSATPDNSVNRRVQAKRARLQRRPAPSAGAPPDPPTYICVVEFSQPLAKMVVVP